MTAKRLYFTSLLTILFLMAESRAFAYDAQIDGIYYNFSGTEATVTCYYYPYYSGNVVIPASVTYNGKTYSVTSIGSLAFSECSGLTSINIPEGVTSIGSDAFYGTAWYKNQPDGLVYAGVVAYTYKGTMPQNTSINLKEGTKGIADYAFSGCSGLTSITIPESVTSISDFAFHYCSGLTSVTIPESVTSIGSDAFYRCSGLTSITIPESVTSIGDYAFYYCSGLTSVTIPESVTTI